MLDDHLHETSSSRCSERLSVTRDPKTKQSDEKQRPQRHNSPSAVNSDGLLAKHTVVRRRFHFNV